MTEEEALDLSTEELMIRARAAELDPNWCRTHLLLATLIHEVQSFVWGFAGGKGPRPVEPFKHIPWTLSYWDKQAMKEQEEENRAASMANLQLMVARGE